MPRPRAQLAVPGSLPVTAPSLDPRGVRRLVARLVAVLRDSDGQSNIVLRFDELTKLLFAKAMADLRSDRDSPFEGDVAPHCVREYYRRLAAEHETLVPRAFAELRCSDRAIQLCAGELRAFELGGPSFDLTGLAYEEAIRNTFDKGDNQQFFTPPHLVEFMVGLASPFVTGRVCDPASGTGGFLASVARRRLPYTRLTGIEIDERLRWVTGINLALHGAHDLETMFFPEVGALGPSAEPLFGTFDAILTNPPFGSDLSAPDALSRFELGVGRPSRRRGILFVERCHDLLRDEGVLAVIVDDGVLNLPHARDLRRFVLSRFDLLAVVGLPESAFMPYANVHASVLLLRKRAAAEAHRRVLFAKAETVGRKPNGDEDVVHDRDGKSRVNSDLPGILDAFAQLRRGASVPPSHERFCADVAENLADDGGQRRLDFAYHHPSRRASRDLLAACPWPVRPLGELCTEKLSLVVPAASMPDTVIPYTGLVHIESGTGVAGQVPTAANSLRSAVKAYERGDVLFAKLRPNLRKVVFVDFPEAGFTSPECAVLTVKRGADGAPLLDPLLLAVLLRSDLVHGQILHRIAGIGRPRISPKELRQIAIPIPPKAEQARIREAFLAAQAKARALEVESEAIRVRAGDEHARAIVELSASFTRTT